MKKLKPQTSFTPGKNITVETELDDDPKTA
jgi:hypothetical protein